MTATVAAIIPVYNAEATVIEALESIDRQSFTDLVIIAIDDGSTDNSPALLNSFAVGRDNVVLLRHDNHGAAYSRNRGIRYAKERGIPFVAFLDADDVWHEDKLAWQMKAFDLHPDIDLVVTRMDRYENLPRRERSEPDGRFMPVIEEFFESLCLDGFTFPPASVVIRSDRLDEGYMYDPEYSCGEDFLPFMHLAYKGSCLVHVQVPLYFERSLPGSLQRGPKSVFIGNAAKLRAVQKLAALARQDGKNSERRLTIFAEAQDQCLSGMIYGARRCLPYRNALLLAFGAFGRYKNKRSYLAELVKTCVYPLRPSRL